ncbi:ShlB/FhaC/HecB family hemolysin secretion/activation protein [Nostoc sp. FACHB-133]|uniref:ShlB/FhaC/HecB family hemolysin secretion/activation protein n=1 Tax=Nostoc sp. FACHB-133 TaxID=2692835 RepID=UPI001689588A|nr:ShlB/FhaC/HecB family hemolysin secretion/activation protein [Nostoc sp. FACHB-133]MBD2526470.1 ShlB/FhaC/HecB family hemolysin secretion/activation protein [Nostoc sp. FACHB-133]
MHNNSRVQSPVVNPWLRTTALSKGLKSLFSNTFNPLKRTLSISPEIDFPMVEGLKIRPRLLLPIATLALSLPVSFSTHTVALAQVPINAPSAQNLPPNLPPPRDLVPPLSPPPQPQLVPSPLPEDILPNQQPPQQLPQSVPPVPDTFSVTKFQFEGSTVFKDEELLQAMEVILYSPEALDEKTRCEQLSGRSIKLSPLRRLPRTEKDAQQLSFAQLLKARSAITQLYICKGYITSGAVVPEQKLEGGVVKIQLVEGSLEGIKITGTRRLNRSYIRSRLERANQKPLNRDRLLEALNLLQFNPRIDSLSAELSAGTRFGTNLLEVNVKEANTFHGEIKLDNSRSPSVGSFQRSARLWEDNLFGIGDTISLFYANTDGSNEVDVGYTLPLTPQDTTLTFSYSHTSNNVIEEPFNELDIVSNSDRYQLSLRHPFIQTPTKELALGLTLSHQRSQTFLGFEDIGAFPLSPGADNQGRTRISALRFFQEWTQRGDRSVLALRSQFSFGLPIFDATINDVGSDVAPDSEFFAWRGQAQWVRRFGTDTLLVLRGDMQLADRRLVSLEQFGVGGIASVRGYRQDQLLTDNGAFGSIELRIPILRIREPQGLLQLVPFFDVGTAWNNFEGADPDPSWLASVGLGLRFEIRDHLNARLDWGIPIVSADSNERTLQENGLYFSIVWNPF